MIFSVQDVLVIAQVGVEVVNLLAQAELEGREVTPKEMATAFATARGHMDAADKRFDQAVADRTARREGEEPASGG